MWKDVIALLRLRPDVLREAVEKHLARERKDVPTIKRELAKLDQQFGRTEEEEAALWRKFRNGTMTEARLDQQLEEVALERGEMATRRTALERELLGASAGPSILAQTDQFIAWVGDQVGEPDLDFATQPAVIHALVVGGTVRAIPRPFA